MSTEKPTILLIPGAWHKASAFEPVAIILRSQGYHVETMTLLSAGGPTSTTVADDAEDIRQKYLNDLVVQGKEVVVVMHSYSGIPGTESVKGLARKDRAARNEKGGVIALVYVAAFLIPAGQSVESFMPAGLDPAMTIDGDITHPKDPKEKFYNDLDERTAAPKIEDLVYHALPSFRTPLTYEAYRDVPSTFLICKQDTSFGVFAQETMATLPGDGVVRSQVCEGGHVPMFSVPQAVADVIHDAASAGHAV